ncbi:hypothetical protein V2P20_07355 [Methylobacter sp. Wu1]|uniref:hypothetical protein n=1 Tax=Methylobacter sp. Wu1 TaxID=3119359 RepID=UPI002F941AF3
MKILRKVLLSLLIAASMGAVSTSAMAEAEKGRIEYAPAEAINMTVDKIKAAQDAIKNGEKGAAVADLIKGALDISKEINANDKVDRARSKANTMLKNARNHAKNNSLQEAEQELQSAEKAFNDLKGMI